LLLASAFLTLGSIPVKAESYEWKDDFNYVSLNEMEIAGWVVGNRDYTDVKDGYVILDNDGSVGSYLRYRNFPYGIYDWKAESNGMWIGRSYGSLHIIVETERHTYSWWGDGYYPEFVFSRDEAKVFRFSGYQPKLNEWFTFTLEKRGNTLYMYLNGKLMKTYVEPDESPSAVKGVGVNSAWIGKTKYDYASLSGRISEDVNEARKILYENYAKLMNGMFWMNQANEILRMFGDDFMSSFTNPLAILKKITTSTAIGDYTNAESSAKELGGLISFVSFSDVSFAINWAYSQAQVDPTVINLYRWGYRVNASQEILDILLLTQQNNYNEAKSKIGKLTYYLQVAESRVDSSSTLLPVTKQSVSKSFDSATKFLTGEAHSFLEDETLIKLSEKGHKLYLHVYDSQGRHVGINQTQVEIGIEEAIYVDFGQEIRIILPSTVTQFKYVVDASQATEEKELYNITITTFKNWNITSTITDERSVNKGEKQEFSVRVLEDKTIQTTPIPAQFNPWPMFVVAIIISVLVLVTVWILILRKRFSSTSAKSIQ
jgi:hypothetical protein